MFLCAKSKCHGSHCAACRNYLADGDYQRCQSDEIGTLEVGKKADLILVDLNKPHFAPWNNSVSDLVYSAQGSDVKTTIVNGKILMKDYEVLTMDAEKIMAEAARIARAVL